jgi:hypothetical protein
MMHPTELRFVEIAKRYIPIGVQAANAMNMMQGKLQLELVLSKERLTTSEGISASLDTLSQLTALTQTHKSAFEKIMVTFSGEYAAVVAEMPQDLQAKYRADAVASINWQLEAQSKFYLNREEWIASATEICNLVESCRDTCTFSGETIDFADDDDLERFIGLMERIEEIHQTEVAALAERMRRQQTSLAVLGIEVRS